ncbi:MAG: hypothetical protein KME46_12620 [Brasilonema angustatum HA4187-MV1]|jgi:hypothetical protein|nr:hypothetical protein [Brasilonema angustatum HA4187-MV1]
MYEKILDIKIGHVLAYAPKSPDGIWLDVAVCEIVEEIASIELERAIQTGVYNKCLVVTKLIDQGEVQERQLAQTYRSYAIAVGDTHPRTAAILRRIADSYNSDAYKEDIWAELEDY